MLSILVKVRSKISYDQILVTDVTNGNTSLLVDEYDSKDCSHGKMRLLRVIM
jgi:hypothetical protein